MPLNIYCEESTQTRPKLEAEREGERNIRIYIYPLEQIRIWQGRGKHKTDAYLGIARTKIEIPSHGPIERLGYDFFRLLLAPFIREPERGR